MANQKGGLAVGLPNAGEIGQLLHQMRPVVGHRVLRIVAVFVDGMHLESALAQVFEHQAVSAPGKTVAMREDDAPEHV